MARPLKLPHVKFVTVKGRRYAYFDTGKRKPGGQIIYAPMPPPSSAGFYDSYASLKAARTRREQPSDTVVKLAADYEASETFKLLADGTKRLYASTIRRIAALLGDYPVNDLQRADVQLVLDNDMAGPGAHNIFVAVLGIIYKWGAARDRTTLEPTKFIERLDTGEHDAWPEHVLEAALECDHDRTRLAVHLLYFTGQRIGDVCAMRWSDIRRDTLFVTQQKTGKVLQIPLHRELRDELAKWPHKALTIIASHAGEPMTPQVIRRELKAFGDKFGVAVVPHGLRKNAVISLLEAGCTVAEAAAITGQTFNIVEYYARQVDQSRLGSAAILKFENKRGAGKAGGKPDELSSNSNGSG